MCLGLFNAQFPSGPLKTYTELERIKVFKQILTDNAYRTRGPEGEPSKKYACVFASLEHFGR